VNYREADHYPEENPDLRIKGPLRMEYCEILAVAFEPACGAKRISGLTE
jgi:hypothetical protein